MKSKYAGFVVAFLLMCAQDAQTQSLVLSDSLLQKRILLSPQKRVTVKSFITPVSLFAYGVCVNKESLFISDAEIKEERDERFSHFHTTIDDYLQFEPIAQAYAMMINH